MLEKKIWSLSQERQIIINAGSNLEPIDLYEYDNHINLYKIIVKSLHNFKNRSSRDGRTNCPIIQN